MTESVFQGPLVSAGSLLNGNGVSPDDGPLITYQGEMIPDPRFSPINKDGTSPARVPGFYSNPTVTFVDAIPSGNNTALVAAAQAPSTTAGVALALVTAQAGTAAGVTVFAPGIPIIPSGTTTRVTVSAIDFGFATGTTVANSSTVVVDDNTKFQLGQWIVIAGAGASGATNVALFAQVQSLSTNTTVLTISPSAATAGSHLPIGQGNLYNVNLPPATQFGPAAASANAAEPYRAAGMGKALDPMQGVARALTVAAASIGSGTTNLLVTGYDIYGVPMTEYISCSGTTVVNGKKAFKYIVSVATASTAATTVTPANVQVGVSDVFGLHLRSDKWEYLSIGWNNCQVATSAGWTAALATTSSSTTIDVRGTVNASTLGISSIASSNGVRRLNIQMSVPINNIINATPLNATTLFGVAQA